MCVDACAHVLVCVCICMHVYMYMFVHLCACLYMCECMCVNVRVCVGGQEAFQTKEAGESSSKSTCCLCWAHHECVTTSPHVGLVPKELKLEGFIFLCSI